MNKEEITNKLKSLIKEYEVCYKESVYEGNFEEYKSLKETHGLLENTVNYISKLEEDRDNLLITSAKQVFQIDLKDKIIDLMAESCLKIPITRETPYNLYTKEDWKDYFYKKVEGENES